MLHYYMKSYHLTYLPCNFSYKIHSHDFCLGIFSNFFDVNWLFLWTFLLKSSTYCYTEYIVFTWPLKMVLNPCFFFMWKLHFKHHARMQSLMVFLLVCLHIRTLLVYEVILLNQLRLESEAKIKKYTHFRSLKGYLV